MGASHVKSSNSRSSFLQPVSSRSQQQTSEHTPLSDNCSWARARWKLTKHPDPRAVTRVTFFWTELISNIFDKKIRSLCVLNKSNLEMFYGFPWCLFVWERSTLLPAKRILQGPEIGLRQLLEERQKDAWTYPWQRSRGRGTNQPILNEVENMRTF